MHDTGGHSFESYYKRALSPLAVLNQLAEKPSYPYELSQIIKGKSNGRFSKALLYPVLYRLEEQGYIRISSTEIIDNRARNYYVITDAGREYLASVKKEFIEMTHAANLLLGIED